MPQLRQCGKFEVKREDEGQRRAFIGAVDEPTNGLDPLFALLLLEGKITEEVIQNILSWKHSGFSVSQSVRLEAREKAKWMHIDIFLQKRGS